MSEATIQGWRCPNCGRGMSPFIQRCDCVTPKPSNIPVSQPEDSTAPLGDNTGHGHVWRRPDGLRARCGGPTICVECAIDLVRLTGADLVRATVASSLTQRERGEKA